MRCLLMLVACTLCLGNAIADKKTAINATSLTQAEAKVFFGYKDRDIVIGDPKSAIVTVTGYTSYSCPHCSHFIGDIVPRLKKDYFENPGKNVIYIYRTFPMSPADIKAKQLVMCRKMSTKDKIKLNEVLYATSARWAYTPQFEKKLTEIARLFGFTDKEIVSCMSSKDLEQEVMKERMELLAKTRLYGVPLIVINGKSIEGYGYKTIVEAIEHELKQNK